MLFEWHEGKRRDNIERRKVDFLEAVAIFNDPEIIKSVDRREEYGEERLQALGRTGDAYYLVAYTWRGAARHIITAWKVGEHGRRRYEALFARRGQRAAREGSGDGDT